MFQRNLSEYSQGRFASWTAWTVPRTMSVTEAAKRVDMSEGDLRSVNTIPPRMLIKAGSVLVVPRAPNVQEDVTSHVAHNGQLSLAPEITLRRTTIKAGKHDSVTSIARRYHVLPAQVAEWNDLAVSSVFKPGQRVVLHLPVRARAAAAPRARNSGAKRVAPAPRAKAVVKRPRR